MEERGEEQLELHLGYFIPEAHPLASSEGHEVGGFVEFSLLGEEPLRPEGLRLLPEVGVHVNTVQEWNDVSVLRDDVALKLHSPEQESLLSLYWPTVTPCCYTPDGPVSCAQGNHGGPPHHLVDGGPGVGQVGHVLHTGQSVRLHNPAQLGLYLGPHLGLVDHEEDGPLQGRLDGLHPGREDIQDDLLQLALGVDAVEDIKITGFGSFLDLDQVGVDEVPGIVCVQGGPVLLDDELDKLQHLLTVVLQRLQSVVCTWEVFQHREEDHVAGLVEQSEALVEEMHEPLELLVVMFESCGHDHAADDVAHGTVQHWGRVDRVLLLSHDGVEEVVDLLGDTGLQLLRAHTPVLHTELLLMQKSPLIFPQFSFSINDS